MKNTKNLPSFYIAYLASSLRNWTAFVLGRIFFYMEVFKSVVGYEGLYEVSNLGRVKSLVPHNRRQFDFLKQSDSGKANTICLFKEGKKKTINVHRLVLEAFIGTRPKGLECCHNDGNYKNNHIDNLRWDTHLSNTRDTINHGKFVCTQGERHGMSKLNNEDVLSIKNAIAAGYSDTQISKMYSITRRHANSIRNGKLWNHI